MERFTGEVLCGGGSGVGLVSKLEGRGRGGVGVLWVAGGER